MKKDFFKGRLSGKSTAAVICFCLAAVAALGIFSYNRSADELKKELSGISDVTVSETTAQTEEAAADANAPAKVPMGGEAVTQANAPQEDIMLENDAFGGSGVIESTVENDLPAVSDEMSDAVVRPVSGEIVSPFSEGELVKSRTLNVWKTHDGIDIRADLGTAVRSVTSGTVMKVERDPMMGVTVVIDHGRGYEGYYCNLADETKVSEGDTVSAGTDIGTVGSTADAEISEEPHLHFGLKKNGSWTDPAEFLSGEGS